MVTLWRGGSRGSIPRRLHKGGPKVLGYRCQRSIPAPQPRPPPISSALPRTVTRSTTMSYLNKWFNTKQTPQSAPITGTSQVANSAGGFAFAVDDWTRLDRFLILGSEGGSYYASERKLTRENAQAVLRCLQLDGRRAVERIVAISDG